MITKLKTYSDADCIEYDVLLDNVKIAYVVEYADDSAEIYYAFDEHDQPTANFLFDDKSEVDVFIENRI